ncbi:hypothetical protein VB796_06535 [Arcicella sp. LKC2W]|uniref:hypothetical protein n=1 Tax=Arcicella sp. LKC2W TaxID=2984198 RepID=UPI002B1F03A7|nr:hypothetical protein [Arcicella sp. LKC2W]MEA5458684.1 hypothetical protein [Arcicella sp. LKC2W]
MPTPTNNNELKDTSLVQTPEIKSLDTIKDKSKDVDIVQTTPNKELQILCERGDFWFGGVRYHHDALDDETAQMLIDKGYTQIKFQ